MSFVRQPVLKPEVEQKLRPMLEKLWNRGILGPEIAEELRFGVPDTLFEKLKPYHVYFYRGKFDLEPRRIREKGVSRYIEKQEELMPWQEFCETLDKKLEPHSFHNKRKRSYLIFHYWTPLRKSEIYERTIFDFEIKKEMLVVHLLRKKKVYHRSVTDEPLNIPLAFPKMDEVVKWLVNKEWESRKFNPDDRPWNISHQTAWNYVREVFKGYYPHFFRFNFITEDANDPETSLAELRAKTGLHIVTLNSYLMKSSRLQEAIDKRRLERMQLQEKPTISSSKLKWKRKRRPQPKQERRKKKVGKVIKTDESEEEERKEEVIDMFKLLTEK